MTTLLTLEEILAELRDIPSFRCIDLQVIEDSDQVLIRATVASGRDRARLLEALDKTLEGKKFSHTIQIDPLLDTPFSPTLPLSLSASDTEASDDDALYRLFEGGQRLTDAYVSAFKQ